MRREKIRRVRVAALMVEDEGFRASLVVEIEACAAGFTCCFLRERWIETKVGRAIVDNWRGDDVGKASG